MISFHILNYDGIQCVSGLKFTFNRDDHRLTRVRVEPAQTRLGRLSLHHYLKSN